MPFKTEIELQVTQREANEYVWFATLYDDEGGVAYSAEGVSFTAEDAKTEAVGYVKRWVDANTPAVTGSKAETVTETVSL